jgi:hypothetical protein
MGGVAPRTACALALLALAAPAAARADQVRAGSVYARVSRDEVVLGNSVVERRWARAPFATTALVDRRSRRRTWSGPTPDFALRLAGADAVSSEAFGVSDVRVQRLDRGGLRVTMELSGPGLSAERVAEAYPGIAGLRTQTILRPAVPLALAGATLERAVTGAGEPSLTALRAGADWREPGWSGPPVSVGDPHAGTWRDTRTAGRGEALAGPGQWLEVRDGDAALVIASEANDLPSVRAGYDGTAARAEVAYDRDAVVFGPLEEDAHAENPTPLPAGRARVVAPGVPFALPATFVGLGRGDADAAWQFHRYLVDHRLAPYPHAVTFNSNGTDDNRISTGAKDDMDEATVREVAPIARRLGIETFVLDDGWQAVSGDWDPDCPGHADPRGRWPARFGDCDFAGVREAIAPMRLGLWMSPMHFNPASGAYREHPDWACAPVGHALAADNALQPDGGSNEAGIGEWGPAAIPWVESRIRRAIEQWGVTYFKFDFLAWLDCAGQGDFYDMHDGFVAMLDRLRADHPGVTFQIDETNDYRLFPYESVSRGPTWFQNGAPGPERLLHNLWDLSPYVPGFAIGQHMLGGDQWRQYPVDTLMAAALPGAITVFSDLRRVPAEVIDQAAPWVAFYREHRDAFGQLLLPLLDDPLAGGWTALQSWDPERGYGALLAFRQESDEATRRIALRDVPPGRTFTLRAAPGAETVGTVTSAQLREGIDVTIPDKRGARVLLVEAQS